MEYETNIFKIENFEELSAQYRIFDIVGLNSSSDEYEANLQHLVRKLSFTLKNPVIAIERKTQPKLVVRDESNILEKLPSEINLTRITIYLKPTSDVLVLNYLNYTELTKDICLRFLNFDLQNHLNKFPELWQPGAGRPFYFKHADMFGKVGIHNGFAARFIELPTKEFGVLIEPTRKFVLSQPLPSHLTRDRFAPYKGKHFVYHFGHRWYEIKAEELHDLNASEYKYQRGTSTVSLIDDLRSQTGKPHPKELADLSNDTSVIFYRDNSHNLKGVPSSLCYLVPDSEDPTVSDLHDRSILGPQKRREEIKRIQNRFLDKIQFGTTNLLSVKTPFMVPKKLFQVPDFEFGNNAILSVRGTEHARKTDTFNLGKARKTLLLDSIHGFFSAGPFDRQYFVLPESINDSMGKAFLEELKKTVERMYPSGGGYNPIIVTYDDRSQNNYIEMGWRIINTVKSAFKGEGYGLVMIPDYSRQRKRKHDELAALIIRELQDIGIFASIIHTETVRDSFYLTDKESHPVYKIKDNRLPKLIGYINNVAINKILLTNNKWPFVLRTSLFADLTIGIDVKAHTAAFTSIDKLGKEIRTDFCSSKQKEKLSAQQTYAKLKVLISKEAKGSSDHFKRIVIHRDGKIFDTERKGILSAINDLIKEDIISPSIELAILEIAKHSSATLRLFEVTMQSGASEKVDNPQIGSFVIMNTAEAYLCSTGREFFHKGSTNPLLIRYDYGTLDFEKVLEDFYYLTSLAFTRPEDCSRYPLTLKITDRRLSEVASDYDTEALALIEELAGETNE